LSDDLCLGNLVTDAATSLKQPTDLELARPFVFIIFSRDIHSTISVVKNQRLESLIAIPVHHFTKPNILSMNNGRLKNERLRKVMDLVCQS